MVAKKSTKARSRKWQDLVQYFVLIAIIFLLNFIATQFFFRIDLTEENRYTIAPATRELLRNVDDVVYVEVYLEGEFPAGFKRLQQAIKETLDEFRIYGGDNIQYRFIDPSANPDTKSRNEYYQQLAKKGIQPTNLFAMEGDKRVEKIIFPGAVVSYGDKEVPVLLLKGNAAASPEQRLNQSVEGVEYELASAIKKLTVKKRKRIAVIQGHGELDEMQMADYLNSLKEYYDVFKVNLPEKISLEGFDAILVAKPQNTFSEPDKFKMDQFIIRGGKALFFVDATNANLDSIGQEGTFAFPYNLNLDDFFFKYGVRLNPDLIQDINSGMIPMVVGYMGDQPQTTLVNWRFFPLLNNFSKHPVTRNLDAVYAKFIGSIDTVKAAGITKTPLVFTSRYSRILPTPVRLNFNEARVEVNPKLFTKGPLPVGYLLEGKFQSVYTNRLAPHTEKTFQFQAEGKESRIIVFSDGDMVRNDINKRTMQAYELGYDRFAGIKFANKELAMNAMDYLLDESGLILVRGKEITMRPLDRIKIKEEKTKWQVINLVVPIVLILIFGAVWYYLRKRKYEHIR
ncbi:MAG: gliding motility-associated ABC transporter substrate-binding protein GldG [Hymenobacteraceae bacterium]|nr:gliding motility-associated ABC transporter substrate-binding protein GldG [Hymenobacteraceae bacterium]MDX5395323.1 gliding motility-associated ABC transporter substrate-binding protein GldG [Hymenobacteraceae bacterium]MDX5444193.1 gliding motility-associated ABC transporter substrate-binding protein GldG [Hymenobacteraceae bacterium]MDX5511370.1 gliding motility-associated ABC transporter substrate-binding protein GldG [Hymenobacteraceae bacterium]